jgi:hypothetical protein
MCWPLDSPILVRSEAEPVECFPRMEHKERAPEEAEHNLPSHYSGRRLAPSWVRLRQISLFLENPVVENQALF